MRCKEGDKFCKCSNQDVHKTVCVFEGQLCSFCWCTLFGRLAVMSPLSSLDVVNTFTLRHQIHHSHALTVMSVHGVTPVHQTYWVTLQQNEERTRVRLFVWAFLSSVWWSSVWASPARASLFVHASPCVAHMFLSVLWRSLCVPELRPWLQLPCFF